MHRVGGQSQNDLDGQNPNHSRALGNFRNAPEIIDSHQSRQRGIVQSTSGVRVIRVRGGAMAVIALMFSASGAAFAGLV